ncbi:Uncharacterised protein [Streptococcus pyogenes]|uniref:Uncharacterized protein n=5 Tax=Streptococcus TaxID=1301 RepID=A0A380IZV1_STRAG|nr:hypothetical protein SCAZ3_04505 [Streptococcus canis FSL Z3-227]EPT36491.1 hypothetical protein SAG0021_09075 [Streptococcus agalactiae FSL S3-277]EPT38115.1 hypothetical protein SAG0029_01960 [Streptococcus agalactiae FSL S3-501]EPT38973.1 hypothetical protein SAG0024_05125 [Streptococcus agalactiae FSL C1-494]EPT41945.1 hypothetical protein SAG0030_08645 [Streptococcus agalactiae FSL S3-603]EPT48314.1 hypothetical protein SAG0042_02390 [Streptococcus agalactiae FSL F2-343]EPT50218.1 hyp
MGTVNIQVEIDPEAYVTGLEHAKETKLMPEELLEGENNG